MIDDAIVIFTMMKESLIVSILMKCVFPISDQIFCHLMEQPLPPDIILLYNLLSIVNQLILKLQNYKSKLTYRGK